MRAAGDDVYQGGGLGDAREDRARRVALEVDVEIGADQLDEALAVGGVIDGEARRSPIDWPSRLRMRTHAEWNVDTHMRWRPVRSDLRGVRAFQRPPCW